MASENPQGNAQASVAAKEESTGGKFDRNPTTSKFTNATLLFQALEKFHRDIQVYAVAIYEMSKFRVSALADFNETARHEILGNVVENTRQVFCELESLIAEIKKQSNPGLLKLEKDHLQVQFAKRDDSLTDLCTTDWAILSAYSEFMRQWRMIMRQVIRPKGKGKRKNILKQNIKQNKPNKRNRNRNKQDETQVNVRRRNNKNADNRNKRKHKNTKNSWT